MSAQIAGKSSRRSKAAARKQEAKRGERPRDEAKAQPAKLEAAHSAAPPLHAASQPRPMRLQQSLVPAALANACQSLSGATSPPLFQSNPASTKHSSKFAGESPLQNGPGETSAAARCGQEPIPLSADGASAQATTAS